MTRKISKKGGFIPAAALAGMAGRAAFSYLAPKAINWASKKFSKKKKGGGTSVHGGIRRRGNGTNLHGNKGNGTNLHGSHHGNGTNLHGGRGMASHNKALISSAVYNRGDGIKQIMAGLATNSAVKNIVKNTGKNMVKGLIKKQANKAVNYIVDNPDKVYNNVKKVFKGGEITKIKKIKSMNVKPGRILKRQVAIEGTSQGGRGPVTTSRPFKHQLPVKTKLNIVQRANYLI